ncbi:hypothetical protein B9Z55_021787 [Caenorhabditis nigoni]|uniref:RGS domain-containing protein n=1 Tax=Caenorhabditis nigoni TaxID=1611254 RepID=A0A2G5TUF2_9PELO|nr:hypothetical protein B9Z55_021787 [Caenorhabditis nigoni]
MSTRATSEEALPLLGQCEEDVTKDSRNDGVLLLNPMMLKQDPETCQVCGRHIVHNKEPGLLASLNPLWSIFSYLFPEKNTTNGVKICEIKLWSESFFFLMSSYHGKRYFSEFVKSDPDLSNKFAFWKVVWDWSHIEDYDGDNVEMMKHIYDTFIDQNSHAAVKLDQDMLDRINAKTKLEERWPEDIFDEAMSFSFFFLKREAYIAFQHSDTYQNLLKS